MGNEELRRVAVMSMEVYTNAEIATAIGQVEPTIEPKRKRIREIWAALGFGPTGPS